MRIKLLRVVVATALCALAVQPALAQHRDGHGFYGRDFHRFTPAERHVWTGGHWEHGWHDNRFAWWWVTGGLWYFYTAPVYPYPTYVPPAVVVQQAPPMPTGLPPMQLWYFCDNPQGYYPYVASCNVPWRPVPVTPAR